MFILDDILLSPLKGLIWLADKVDEVAQKELYDKDNLKAKLMELQLRFELDEISEAEYTKQEADLLERLNIDMGGEGVEGDAEEDESVHGDTSAEENTTVAESPSAEENATVVEVASAGKGKEKKKKAKKKEKAPDGKR